MAVNINAIVNISFFIFLKFSVGIKHPAKRPPADGAIRGLIFPLLLFLIV